MAGFFFTGEEAAALTPKSIERRRALLDALGKDAYSTAPVQHWTQGAARLANALANNFEERRLNKSETKGTNDANAAILAALGMGASGASSPMPAGPSAAAGGVASPPVAAPDVSRETLPPMPPVRPPAATPPAGAPAWAGAMPSVMPTGSLDQSGTMPKPPVAMAMAPGAAAEGQPSEQELVIRTIAAETSGKSPEEAQAIAAVILNRAKTRGLSPADVVLERNQFEPWNGGPGGRNDPMNISPNSPRYAQAAQALQAAMGGQDPTRGATHFFAPQAQAALGRRPPAWAQGPGQQIGATAFYAPEGRAPGGAVPVSGDAPAPGAQEAQNLQRPPSGQMNIPGQQQAAPDRAQALIRALSNPWAQQANPMLAGVAQKMLADSMQPGQVISRPDGSAYVINPRTMQAQQIMGPTGQDPQQQRLRELEIKGKERDLAESKPFEISIDGEKVTVSRDAQGNLRRVQLAGETGPAQPKTYKLPDGREVPLPADSTARKKALEQFGTSGAKAVENAPQAVQSAAQTISTIDQILGPQNPKTGKFDKPHPGLSWRVGTIFGAAPSMYGTDGAGFDALQKQVTGKAFLEAFESLKGGGAITEVEGNKAQAAIARLDVKQKPEDYMKALQELREIARTGMERARAIAAGGKPPPQAAPKASGGWTEVQPGVRIREMQ